MKKSFEGFAFKAKTRERKDPLNFEIKVFDYANGKPSKR